MGIVLDIIIPDADVVSDRSDSVPPLEGGLGLSDEEEFVGSEQDQWGRMGERGDSLQTAVAAWDEERLEGRYLEPGTIVRLETTIKDLDSLRQGAERTRTSVDVGHLQELVCANLRYDASVNPVDLVARTAGSLKTALAYPNLSNVVVQVTSIRLCRTHCQLVYQ